MEDLNWESLENYRVLQAPQTAFYIPNFITISEENNLIKHIYNAPKPKWTCLSNRRLQDYGGIPHSKGMIPESIPSWLQSCMDTISELGIFINKNKTLTKANHCLINEYEPGQGIMPHVDGHLFTPVISTVSLASHTILNFHEEINDKRSLKCKLLLEPRSLIVLTENMYSKYLHGIDFITADVMDETVCNLEQTKFRVNDVLARETRLSLTIRNVPKVINCNIFNLNKK